MKIEKEKESITCFVNLKAGDVFRVSSSYFICTASPSTAVNLKTGDVLIFNNADEVELKPTAKVVFE